ncbi:hypothetical protein [Sphingomonas sp. SRS2]|uniref:hypothetical protein n=1 Tax=Sphingomonas sp. SRS2 TaxID=133190 RepID=UPI000618400E|nr:hypothetical protein [Sphingomonas sp. SRS2]KKC24844.1 hypothetical protein WP12_16525 [Sphingomonas sp. SRS2]
MKTAIVAALLLGCASPAAARSIGERIADLPDEQKAAVAVSAIDAAWTVRCLDRGTCREVGPMALAFGQHPNAAQVIGTRMGTIILSSVAVSIVQDRDPGAARTIARVNLIVTGTTIGIHFKREF